MKTLNKSYSLLGEQDIYHIKQGSEYKLYEKLGSHYVIAPDGKEGVYFALWAPNARYISVIGDFNHWDKGAHKMIMRRDDTGIWECFIADVPEGSSYKYYLESKHHEYVDEKSDPHAFFWEVPPRSATKTWKLDYRWGDDRWMQTRSKSNSIHAPISIYEMHLGSWKRRPEEGNRSLTYRELAEELPAYIAEIGFTHVEFLPVTEHPFDGSWGYQTLGYFAPTSRFGTPQDFMHLVDKLHQAGIGVILDWVPSHFAVDMHGLANFDGTNIYEHADPRQGFHPDWGSSIFNLGRNEVKNFLISSALFWFEKYHIDGIRVDAVASMLYLNYGRKEGEWVANKYGGKENLESVEFLQTLNHHVYQAYDDVMMIAEDSTSWPMVTKPTYLGGLGFEYKWNMGWMHDTLKFLSTDPILRKYHQDQITFSIWYAFHEQFMLALSHDEVVHMKGSLINKMPGDAWQKFANLRVLYGYMFAHPGKKLLFMGAEIAQCSEWNYEQSLDWHLLESEPAHQKLFTYLQTIQKLYKRYPALFVNDYEQKGFQWIDSSDHESNVISFIRYGSSEDDTLVIVCNFTPVPRENYKVGVPFEGRWREILNSDSEIFGGSNMGNQGEVTAYADNLHGFSASLNLCLPPLSVLWLQHS
jgi:1,4-alpha-glucan branching enzyme